MLDRAAYFRRWAELHGGYDPGAHLLSRTWLATVYAVARRCPRIPPLAVTAAGVLAAVAVPPLARWPVLAGLAVLLSGFLDSLDGAVAIGTGRDTRFGFVVDSVADRVSDTAYVVAFWVLGAPGWLCAGAAGLAALQEYLRARAAAAGMPEIGVVTVFERPTRIVLATAVLAAAALAPTALAAAVPSGGAVPAVVTVGTAVWAVLGLVGVAQLARTVHRSLD